MNRATFVWLEERARRSIRHAHYQRLLPFVRRAAMRVAAHVPEVSFSELAAWAWLGALEACERSEGDLTSEEIEEYALYRIHGALVDAVITHDPTGSALRELSARVTVAIRRLTAALERPPERGEIARELGMSEADYGEALLMLAERGMTRLETIEDGPSLTAAPDRSRVLPDLRTAVTAAMATLPAGARELLELHYGASLTLRDAAAHLGLDEEGAVQLHTEAVHRLRAAIARD